LPGAPEPEPSPTADLEETTDVPTRRERLELIGAVEEARGGRTLISYVTSTRPNLESSMAMDAVPIVYEHLRAIDGPRSETRIDLFLHSNGGEGTVPWRLMSLLREHAVEVDVLIPSNAFSAGTLTALGADTVVMHPMGMLGPTDPTTFHPFNPPDPDGSGRVLGISVEDVASYLQLVRDDLGITGEEEVMTAFALLARRVHPLALGNVKRLTSQSRMLALKLLGLRPGGDRDAHEDIVRRLTSELYNHGHPINRIEAREDVGLDFVVDATSDEEDAMWALYRAYDADMEMSEPFNFAHELVARGALPPAPMMHPQAEGPPAPVLATHKLGEYRFAYVESSARCDVSRADYEITASRDVWGRFDCEILATTAGWVRTA
jgi:serine dehydrogenase proteinase